MFNKTIQFGNYYGLMVSMQYFTVYYQTTFGGHLLADKITQLLYPVSRI